MPDHVRQCTVDCLMPQRWQLALEWKEANFRDTHNILQVDGQTSYDQNWTHFYMDTVWCYDEEASQLIIQPLPNKMLSLYFSVIQSHILHLLILYEAHGNRMMGSTCTCSCLVLPHWIRIVQATPWGSPNHRTLHKPFLVFGVKL